MGQEQNNSAGHEPAPYLVVRRGANGWNVLKIEPVGGLLCGEVKATFGRKDTAFQAARRASERWNVPLIEGRQ